MFGIGTRMAYLNDLRLRLDGAGGADSDGGAGRRLVRDVRATEDPVTWFEACAAIRVPLLALAVGWQVYSLTCVR
jgi:hypothetical protein